MLPTRIGGEGYGHVGEVSREIDRAGEDVETVAVLITKLEISPVRQSIRRTEEPCYHPPGDAVPSRVMLIAKGTDGPHAPVQDQSST